MTKVNQIPRLLMTGAAGGLGKVMRERLKANCKVLRLSDIVDLGAPQANEEVMTVDLADAKAVEKLLDGVNAVVHFGGISTEKPWTPILQANIVGVYNLYEAARKKGVKRIIFASSNHAIGFYPRSQKIGPDAVPRPDGLYGVSKAFGESLSRFYFDRYGIETACLRIGSSFPEPMDRRMLATWLSYNDLYRLLTACLEVPVLGHTIVYGVSNNSIKWWDNTPVGFLGYQPLDSADGYRDKIYAAKDPEDPTSPATIYQGGKFCLEGPFED
jgi:uronate dehydrogenase